MILNHVEDILEVKHDQTIICNTSVAMTTNIASLANDRKGKKVQAFCGNADM